MIIGNMGSKERFAYTVIGDEANLGARLEAANKDFATRILISEATWRLFQDEIAARELDTVIFRGMARPVRVFEVLGMHPLPGEAARRLEQFAAGLAAYRREQWLAAKAASSRSWRSLPMTGRARSTSSAALHGSPDSPRRSSRADPLQAPVADIYRRDAAACRRGCLACLVMV